MKKNAKRKLSPGRSLPRPNVHNRLHLMMMIFILAEGHVRASAGDLAVHTALIPCVCVRVCPVSNSFLITPRIGTKFVSVDR